MRITNVEKISEIKKSLRSFDFRDFFFYIILAKFFYGYLVYEDYFGNVSRIRVSREALLKQCKAPKFRVTERLYARFWRASARQNLVAAERANASVARPEGYKDFKARARTALVRRSLNRPPLLNLMRADGRRPGAAMEDYPPSFFFHKYLQFDIL